PGPSCCCLSPCQRDAELLYSSFQSTLPNAGCGLSSCNPAPRLTHPGVNSSEQHSGFCREKAEASSKASKRQYGACFTQSFGKTWPQQQLSLRVLGTGIRWHCHHSPLPRDCRQARPALSISALPQG
uniref:Uncharacterized protein n=1 Tax=Gallus gallus TaxID=9031 RepID=A0A8V0XBX7_CHICK